MANPEWTAVTEAAEGRRTRPVVAVASAAPRLAAVNRPLLVHRTDAWVRRLSRVLSLEIQAAVASGLVTAAEADQLLARLVIVIDQATTEPEA